MAIKARAVFDAVNAIEHFSARSYYYSAAHTGSPDAAAAQAAHDVLAAQLPNPAVDATVDARWAQTQAWIDSKLAQARHLDLVDNARLFALLGSVGADARIAAYTSKYDQKFWRPITALNADERGAVTNNYSAWRPLAATPSHPSNTAGHSATGAAGFEVLRAFFGDRIVPNGAPVTLTSLPWLVGTNSGTGNATTRTVSTFTQAQLENGASRLYLGVHSGSTTCRVSSSAWPWPTRSSDPAIRRRRTCTSEARLLHWLRSSTRC